MTLTPFRLGSLGDRGESEVGPLMNKTLKVLVFFFGASVGLTLIIKSGFGMIGDVVNLLILGLSSFFLGGMLKDFWWDTEIVKKKDSILDRHIKIVEWDRVSSFPGCYHTPKVGESDEHMQSVIVSALVCPKCFESLKWHVAKWVSKW